MDHRTPVEHKWPALGNQRSLVPPWNANDPNGLGDLSPEGNPRTTRVVLSCNGLTQCPARAVTRMEVSSLLLNPQRRRPNVWAESRAAPLNGPAQSSAGQHSNIAAIDEKAWRGHVARPGVQVPHRRDPGHLPTRASSRGRKKSTRAQGRVPILWSRGLDAKHSVRCGEQAVVRRTVPPESLRRTGSSLLLSNSLPLRVSTMILPKRPAKISGGLTHRTKYEQITRRPATGPE